MHRHPPLLKCAACLVVLASLTACHPADHQMPVVKSSEVMAVNTPPPDYPLEQACADIGGKVTMKVVIGPEGRATEVSVIGSSGVPALDQAAQDAVRTWEFKPATRNEQPVSQTIQVPMSFTPTPESELCLERDQRDSGQL